MFIKLNELKNKLTDDYDVFIASVSFEDRSVSVLNSIIDKVHLNHKIASLSVPHKHLMEDNLKIFKRHEFHLIEVDNSDQISTVTNLSKQLDNILKIKKDSSFLIDITTFTRQTLLILLRLLRNCLAANCRLQFLYTPAKEYSVGLPEEKKWLSQGIMRVDSVFGFSGIIKPSRPHHLIILMGYEIERASSLISAYEPLKTTIGYARKSDSISEEHYRLNKIRFDELCAEFPYAESFEFSCTNPIECKNDVLKQVKKYSGYNTVVSPMNNKISSLSCALAAFDDETIQMAIAIPIIFNYLNYSIPGDCCYILEIPDLIKY